MRLDKSEAQAIAEARGRGTEPKGIGALVAFFAPRWEAETPTRIHTRAVWHSHVGANEQDEVPVLHRGGSLIGSQAWSDGFRRLLENGAFELDAEGNYARPCRAALQRLAYEGRVVTAARMLRLARSGFDVAGTIHLEGLASEDGEILIREGLRAWWRRYEERPLQLRRTG